MQTWLTITGSVLGALMTLFLALLIARPRVCARVAGLIGTFAVQAVTVGLSAVGGAYLAKRAVLAEAASTYAITDGATADDRWVLEKLAAAVDPTIGTFAGFGIAGALVLGLCAGAIFVARMVIEDESKSRPADGSSDPGEQGKAGK